MVVAEVEVVAEVAAAKVTVAEATNKPISLINKEIMIVFKLAVHHLD